MDDVLVTGGTGYVARWCIAQALEQGDGVRTTVRDRAAEADVRGAIDEAGVDGELTVTVADLSDEAGWAAAVDGCRFVLHPASPFGRSGAPTSRRWLPGRGGVLRVLSAAVAAGVDRVVMASATNTASPTSYRTPGGSPMRHCGPTRRSRGWTCTASRRRRPRWRRGRSSPGRARRPR